VWAAPQRCYTSPAPESCGEETTVDHNFEGADEWHWVNAPVLDGRNEWVHADEHNTNT
jgi:hypothetical protein